METLINIDHQLLLFLNSLHNTFFDVFFWTFTSTIYWIPLYATILYVIFKNQGKKGFVALGAIILLVVLCDQISTNIFKEGFERFRPSHNPLLKDIIHLVNNKRGGKFGFVSSHATNSFGLAVFTSLFFRNKTFSITIISWALLNSYSRIYLGVHFPGDILGGAILGSVIALGCYQLYIKVIPKYILITPSTPNLTGKEIANKFNQKDITLLVYAVNLLIIAALLASKNSVKFI